MALKDSAKLVRPLVQRLHPYVPGEQPKVRGLVKLNTNENPYPPSPKVLAAIKAGVDARLRLYPNPTAAALREQLARLHGCKRENVFVGNGSDEVLALAVRAFVEPLTAAGGVKRGQLARVQFFTPSYSLYPTLAETHGAATNAVPLNPDFTLPSVIELLRGRQWEFRSALTFITTPNAPSGRGYAASHLESICEVHRGIVVLDEAYVDFASEDALSLALKFPHVLVARTFSKAYSLCSQRVGYCVGDPGLIAALDKIRDSYNVNGLGQVAALATLGDLSYYRANFRRIIQTREYLTLELGKLGFFVYPSQTNFILVRPPNFPAKEWLDLLRTRKILVRWFDQSSVRDYLRITIGTPSEADALLRAARSILRSRASA
jgi:histidinol-phosphate aminotransferase